MKRAMSRAELNHLRRMVAWVRCDLGQTPEEFEQTVREISPILKTENKYGIEQLRRTYVRAQNVPKYLRAAVKSLEKFVKENDGYGIVPGESREDSVIDDDKQMEVANGKE